MRLNKHRELGESGWWGRERELGEAVQDRVYTRGTHRDHKAHKPWGRRGLAG